MKKILMILAPFLLVGCSFFKSSKTIDLIPFLQKDKYGFFNLEGKIIINPQFAYATVFREDIALVKTTGDNGKWGYIDKDGKFIINASYKDATVFQEGIAWVVLDNGSPTAIDKNGKILFTLKEAEKVRLFSEGLSAFSKADSTNVTWGFVDKSGKQMINPQFVEVGDFYDGKCAVKNKDGKWGYIDKSGKIVINYQFENSNRFENGKAIVYLDEKAGVIDNDGKYIINPQFKYAFPDKEKYLVFMDDKAGWCDEEGKFIINPQFDSASEFGSNKLACVKSSDKYGYIDEEGKIKINPQFDEATQFIGNIAIVKTGDKYGLIDKEGKYVVNPQFEEIGFDFYAFLSDFSYKNYIDSDYLDTEKILKVININTPENLSFEDSFQTILTKINKTGDEFSAYNNVHMIYKDKPINKDASYDFAIMGKLKDLNLYTYNYYVTKEKPTGFVYSISLLGKAEEKAESVQKVFEKKLSNFTLLKKGYVKNSYTSVYKSDKNIIITTSENSSNPIIYILKKDFDIAFYLDKIGDKAKETEINEDEYSEAAVDTVAIDTTAAAPAY